MGEMSAMGKIGMEKNPNFGPISSLGEGVRQIPNSAARCPNFGEVNKISAKNLMIERSQLEPAAADLINHFSNNAFYPFL